MGVVVLQTLPVPQDKTPMQLLESIQKRLACLGATNTGTFIVECESYYGFVPANIPNRDTGNIPSKIIHVMHNSEQPATVYAVMESNNKLVCLTCDSLFDMLMLKLQGFFPKKLKIESKGPRFEIADFVVKLGIVSIAGSNKGILIEVEYLPCMLPQHTWGLTVEFMQGFLGAAVNTQMPPSLEKKSNDFYVPADTVYQYLEQFAAFRKLAQQS